MFHFLFITFSFVFHRSLFLITHHGNDVSLFSFQALCGQQERKVFTWVCLTDHLTNLQSRPTCIAASLPATLSSVESSSFCTALFRSVCQETNSLGPTTQSLSFPKDFCWCILTPEIRHRRIFHCQEFISTSCRGHPWLHWPLCRDQRQPPLRSDSPNNYSRAIGVERNDVPVFWKSVFLFSSRVQHDQTFWQTWKKKQERQNQKGKRMQAMSRGSRIHLTNFVFEKCRNVATFGGPWAPLDLRPQFSNWELWTNKKHEHPFKKSSKWKKHFCFNFNDSK